MHTFSNTKRQTKKNTSLIGLEHKKSTCRVHLKHLSGEKEAGRILIKAISTKSKKNPQSDESLEWIFVDLKHCHQQSTIIEKLFIYVRILS